MSAALVTNGPATSERVRRPTSGRVRGANSANSVYTFSHSNSIQDSGGVADPGDFPRSLPCPPEPAARSQPPGLYLPTALSHNGSSAPCARCLENTKTPSPFGRKPRGLPDGAWIGADSTHTSFELTFPCPFIWCFKGLVPEGVILFL